MFFFRWYRSWRDRWSPTPQPADDFATRQTLRMLERIDNKLTALLRALDIEGREPLADAMRRALKNRGIHLEDVANSR